MVGPSASGDYITSQFFGSNTNHNPNNLDEMYAMPIFIPKSQAFTAMAATVNVSAATAVHRLGIYLPSATNKPGSLLLDAGTIDSSTTGVKTVSITQTLAGNTLYWLVCVPQVALATIRAFNGSVSGPGVGVGASNVVIQSPMSSFYRVQSVSGALPSNPTWGFVTNTNVSVVPIVGLVV